MKKSTKELMWCVCKFPRKVGALMEREHKQHGQGANKERVVNR